jgi:NAD(P)-dependent dehydrogenase (short-subunit alcohol dehydrogenase family)
VNDADRSPRRVLITGGAGGIGRACASRMGARGDSILLTDLESASLEAAVRDLSKSGIEVDAFACDIARPVCGEEIGDALRSGPRLGALVHTAGLSPAMASWRQIIEVDWVGSVRVLEAAFPFMAPGGVAVCIASIAGHLVPAIPGVSDLLAKPLAPDLLERLEALPERPVGSSATAYAHSKRALRALVSSQAAAWGERGLRIVSVSRGMIETSMGRLEFEQQPAMKGMLDRTPLRRLGEPEEIAAVVDFLCSPGASFITGCDVIVDGGVSAALGALR